MDLCFMTCFSGTLALHSHPGSSLVNTSNVNPIYPKLTTYIYITQNSPSYTSSQSLWVSTSLFVCFYTRLPSCCALVCLHPSLAFPFTGLSVSSWLTKCSPCTPRWCCRCLNQPVCLPLSLHLGENTCGSFLSAPCEEVSLLFLLVMWVKRFSTDQLQYNPLLVSIKVKTLVQKVFARNLFDMQTLTDVKQLFMMWG